MKCPECSTVVSPDKTFCPHCMTRLPARELEGVPETQPLLLSWHWLKQQPLLILLLIIVAAAIGFGLGIVATHGRSRPRDASVEARQMYDSHRYAEAIVAAERAISQGADSADLDLLLGDAYLHQGQYERASEAFSSALARNPNPDLAGAYLGLGQAAFHLGWHETAEDNLNEAVTRMPGSAAAHAYLGALYYRQDQLTEARSQLEKALELDGDNAWARAYLGRTHLELGEAASAISELEQALQADPDDVDDVNGRLALAQAYAAAGQHEKAATAFRRALSEHPGDPEAMLGYSEALLALDQPDKAQEILARALEETDLAAWSREAAIVAGWLHYGNEHYAQASDWFAAALAFDPQSADAHNGRGWSMLRMEECEAAQAAFEEALALKPEGWDEAQTPQTGLERCR